MFGNIGATELIIILVIVLVLFGARKVPEIGASIGKGIREFKRNISDVDKQVRSDDTRERDRERDRLSAGSPDMSSAREEEEARPEPRRLI
jgi:sec-independent protein translocase protein TatA